MYIMKVKASQARFTFPSETIMKLLCHAEKLRDVRAFERKYFRKGYLTPDARVGCVPVEATSLIRVTYDLDTR